MEQAIKFYLNAKTIAPFAILVIVALILLYVAVKDRMKK